MSWNKVFFPVLCWFIYSNWASIKNVFHQSNSIISEQSEWNVEKMKWEKWCELRTLGQVHPLSLVYFYKYQMTLNFLFRLCVFFNLNLFLFFSVSLISSTIIIKRVFFCKSRIEKSLSFSLSKTPSPFFPFIKKFISFLSFVFIARSPLISTESS